MPPKPRSQRRPATPPAIGSAAAPAEPQRERQGRDIELSVEANTGAPGSTSLPTAVRATVSSLDELISAVGAATGVQTPMLYIWDDDFKEWAVPASLDEVASFSRARAEPRDVQVGAAPDPEPEVPRIAMPLPEERSPPPSPVSTWVSATATTGATSPPPSVYRMKRRFNAAAYPRYALPNLR